MATGFNCLPNEILGTVCDILALEYKPGLFAFSLVSTRCFAVANTKRFGHLQLVIKTSEGLGETIQGWGEILQRNDALCAVCRLTVDGRSLCGPIYVSKIFHNRIQEERRPSPDQDELSRRGGHYFDGAQKDDAKYELDGAGWQQLVEFTRKLVGLRELVWLCWRQLPVSLLDVLQADLPSCRLSLPCNHLPTPWPGDKCPAAKSSSLESVAFAVRYFDTQESDVMDHGMLEMALQRAPNLKRVDMLYTYSTYDVSGIDDSVRVHPLGKGLSYESEDSEKPQSQLNHLEVLSLDMAYPHVFEAWRRQNLFANLRVLQLWQVTHDTLFRRAAKCKFTSLQALAVEFDVIDLDALGSDDEETQRDAAMDLDDAASQFLSSLNPLSSLRLESPYARKSFQAALKKHSRSLAKFEFLPTDNGGEWHYGVTPAVIQDIQRQCSALRELTIRIPRTQGDRLEVEIYRTLSTLTHIKHLTMELCFPIGGTFNYTPIAIRDQLVNLAIDEVLARQIFGIVAAPAMQRIRLGVVMVSPTYTMRKLFDVIGGTWEAIPTEGRLAVQLPRHWGTKGKSAIPLDSPSLGPGFEGQFRSLWPSKGGDWWEDWHSFPLCSH